MAAPTTTDALADARTELEARIRLGRLRTADDLREDFPVTWADPEGRLELVYAEYVLRVANGEQPSRDDWFARYPELDGRLERLFGMYDLMAGGDTHRPGATSGDARPVPTLPADANHPDGYEVLGEVGRGGMAVVYQARQLELNRVVALKVLRWGGWEGPDDARRVSREAELVARLQHPNIVQVIEVGEWDGSPFLALEYVPGGTLADALSRLQRQGKTGVSTAEAVALVELLARATQYAHEQGVIHRDLKPANVLLADDPAGPFARPKVTDFGLAVSTELSAAVSQSAMLAGTPCYMAPEQATARRDAVGPRTDVYALGGILYELLTGRPPYQGATVLETLDMVRHAEPVRPRLLRPAVPRDLETVCLKCLAKDPVRRYPTADALADDLARFRDGRPITARPVGAGERAWKWCRRQPLLAGMLCGLLAAVLVAVVLPSVFWRQAEDGRVREAGLRLAAEEREARLLLKTARLQWLDHDLDGARESLAACDEAHHDAEWKYLWRACRPPVWDFVRPPDTRDSPTTLVFSPDGLSLAGHLASGRVRVWSAADGRERYTTEERYLEVSLAHPTADRVLVVHTKPPVDNQERFLVDILPETREVRTGLQLKERSTYPPILSSDGRYLIRSTVGPPTVTDLTTSTAVSLDGFPIGTANRPVNTNFFSFAADNRFLFTVLDSKEVVVWEAGTGRQVRRTRIPAGITLRSRSSVGPTARHVVFVNPRPLTMMDCELFVRDTDAGSPVRVILVPSTPGGIVSDGRWSSSECVTFSPDGHLMAGYVSGNALYVWNTVTGELTTELRGMRELVRSFAFSPDSKRLAVGSSNGRVAIWDITSAGP